MWSNCISETNARPAYFNTVNTLAINTLRTWLKSRLEYRYNIRIIAKALKTNALSAFQIG